MSDTLRNMDESMSLQPWEHLRLVSRKLRSIAADQPLAPALEALGDSRSRDDASHMAFKEIDYGSVHHGFKNPRDRNIDRPAAVTIVREALQRARPRAADPDRTRVLSRGDLELGAKRIGVPLTFAPRFDEKQAAQEARRPEHRILCDRAIGILQRLGRVFRGATGVEGVMSLADLAVLTPDGRLLVVEAMNSYDIWYPNSTYSRKVRMAERLAEQGAYFLFTSAITTPPPWIAVSKRHTRRLWTPTGVRRVSDGWDIAATSGERPKSARIAYLPDPEEVDRDGVLLVEKFMNS